MERCLFNRKVSSDSLSLYFMFQKFRFATLFRQFSPEQKSFLTYALLALLVWLPLADVSWIHHVLVESLAKNAAVLIEVFSDQPPATYGFVNPTNNYCFWNVADNRGRVLIGSSCDGWELYYLGAAFVLIFPGVAWKRKAIFSVLMVAVLYAANVLRVVGLFFISRSHPEWFQLFHKTIFQFLIYLIMFALWIIYLRGNKSKEKSGG